MKSTLVWFVDIARFCHILKPVQDIIFNIFPEKEISFRFHESRWNLNTGQH